MKNVVFAISMVIVGAVLGLFGLLAESLVQWLFSLLPLQTMAGTTLLGVKLPTLIAILAVVLLLGGVAAMVISAAEQRPFSEPSADTQREVAKAIEGMESLQPAAISDNGQYAFIALHVEDKDWNERHPLYSDSVMSSTPMLMQTGRYYYLVAKCDNGRVIPVPMPSGYENELTMEIVMLTQGVDRLNNAFWRGFHAMLADAEIPVPFLKLALTSLCSFFTTLSSKKLKDQFLQYVQGDLFPHISRQNIPLKQAVPKGLMLHTLRCSFKTAGGQTISFTESIHRLGADQIQAKVWALKNLFYPFKHKYTARLLFPLQNLQ